MNDIIKNGLTKSLCCSCTHTCNGSNCDFYNKMLRELMVKTIDKTK